MGGKRREREREKEESDGKWDKRRLLPNWNIIIVWRISTASFGGSHCSNLALSGDILNEKLTPQRKAIKSPIRMPLGRGQVGRQLGSDKRRRCR